VQVMYSTTRSTKTRLMCGWDTVVATRDAGYTGLRRQVS